MERGNENLREQFLANGDRGGHASLDAAECEEYANSIGVGFVNIGDQSNNKPFRCYRNRMGHARFNAIDKDPMVGTGQTCVTGTSQSCVCKTVPDPTTEGFCGVDTQLKVAALVTVALCSSEILST